MSQFQSFFISAFGAENQCENLNSFLKSHQIIRIKENSVNSGERPGIQLLIEYNDVNKSTQRIDWRNELETEEQKKKFDKIKEYRAKLCKEKHLQGAYIICKDEHIAALCKNPSMSLEEFSNLPNSKNIQLKEYAPLLYEFSRNLTEEKTDEPKELPF